MKKIINIISKIFICILLGITLTSCKKGSDSKTITLYFPDFSLEDGTFITKEIEVSSNNKIELIDSVKEALLKGPDNRNEDYKNPYNNIVRIAYTVLENKLLIVNFDGDYYGLNLSEKIAIRTGIAKSYSNFTFVESVRFLQKGNQIVDEYGKKLSDVKIDDIITDINDDYNMSNIANYNLYFGTADGKMLSKEERALEVQSSSYLAKELAQELIKGPSSEGLSATIPKQTKIRQLEIKDGICYVDFSKEFQTKHPGGEMQETLTIFSIVNTLTELPEVEKVQFLIDGEKKDEYQGYYEFSSPFVRDSSLIYKNEKPNTVSNPENVIKVLTDEEKNKLDEKEDENEKEELIKDLVDKENNDKNNKANSNEDTIESLVKNQKDKDKEKEDTKNKK